MMVKENNFLHVAIAINIGSSPKIVTSSLLLLVKTPSKNLTHFQHTQYGQIMKAPTDTVPFSIPTNN